MAAADAYPFPAQSTPLRVAVALASVGVVFLLDALFSSAIDDGSLFLLLGMAVMATAWFVGTGPALSATVLGAVLGYWAAPPAVDFRATPMHLALFVVQGLVLTALISELRRSRSAAESRAREAQAARAESEAASRMKDEFLATISHELRTPLNSVLGWLYLLRTGKLDGATAGRGLEAIERNVRLQAQLTADLLDVSKVLTGTLTIACRPVSLADACRQAVSAAVPAAQVKGVRVTSTIGDPPMIVLGDATRLRQIVWQLLANAIKFTPRGGVVRLSLDRTDDDAVLTVSDNGPGIDPEFLPRIFEPFTQEDSSPTRAAGGLGVGLSLVRDLVQLHGGEIEAGNLDPGADGEGAVLTARFPLHEAAGDIPLSVTVGPAEGGLELDGLRVLVLDQDADGRDLLRTILCQRGATVRTVDSVAEALEALEAWRPDVLVSDSVAPEHDAYALVGRVRSLDAERGGRIPAAALTTAARTDGRVRAMLAAFQSELPKPVEPSLLTAEIARLAGREPHSIHLTS